MTGFTWRSQASQWDGGLLWYQEWCLNLHWDFHLPRKCPLQGARHSFLDNWFWVWTEPRASILRDPETSWITSGSLSPTSSVNYWTPGTAGHPVNNSEWRNKSILLATSKWILQNTVFVILLHAAMSKWLPLEYFLEGCVLIYNLWFKKQVLWWHSFVKVKTKCIWLFLPFCFVLFLKICMWEHEQQSIT